MPAATIDEYLAGIPGDKRTALEALRAQIRAVAPDAAEGISYGVPGFKLDGRYLVGFSATADACSFYTGRGALETFADELQGYRQWKGTINFPVDRPLPADLVTRIVQLRLAEFRSR
jgi:uncharacterized protein YdhG (YjbR/CyaY superfamily)